MARLPYIQSSDPLVGENNPNGLTDTLNSPLKTLITQSGGNPDSTSLSVAFNPFTAQGGSVARTLESRAHDVINVLDYGADNTGVANSRSAIQAAINALPTYGSILFFPPGDYALGDLTAADTNGAMTFTGKYNVRVFAYGAYFRWSTVGSVPLTPRIVHHADPDGFWWSGGQFKDLNSDITVDWFGGDCFYIWGGGVNTVGRIRIEDVRALDCNSLAIIGAQQTAYGVRGVEILRCRAEHCYYGVVFQENGHSSYTSIIAHNCRRAYYVYGVVDFRADIWASDDSTNNVSTACVLIARWANDTRGGRVRLTMEGAAGAHNHAVFITTIAPGQNGIIEDVELDINLASMTNASAMYPVGMTAYDSGNLSVLATTNDHINNIRLKGDWGTYPKTACGINMETYFTNEVRLIVDPMLMPWLFTGSGLATAANLYGIVLQPSLGVEERIRIGDATTRLITIPCAGYDNNPFLLRVEHWINDGELATQDSTYVDDILFCYNAGGGNVVIAQRSPVTNVNVTSAATVVYTPNGENIDVTFTGGAEYQRSTAIVKQRVHRLSAYAYP
jgi:hypothetical protein